MMIAVTRLNPGAVKILLEKGVDVNEADRSGKTPLMRVICRGESVYWEHGDLFTLKRNILEIGKQLINHGADTSLTDEDGKTALDYALKYKVYDVALVLLFLDESPPKYAKRFLHNYDPVNNAIPNSLKPKPKRKRNYYRRFNRIRNQTKRYSPYLKYKALLY